MNNKRIRRTPAEARQQLVAAALLSLSDADFAELTVATITEQAGMTRSAFYHYFSGLDDLVMQLLEEFERQIRDAVDPWLEGAHDDTDDYRAQTTKELTKMYGVFHDHRNVVRVANQAASVSKRVFDQWQVRAVDYYVNKTAAFISRQIMLNRSKIDNPRRVAKALILMNNAVGIDNMLRAAPDDAAEIGGTVSTIWNATIFNVDSAS
ncbi:MAG: TetR/AcrR family transcriptional regulator [Gammaproteobacteria bacterium]